MLYIIDWWRLHWPAKMANYLQNYRTPSVPQHFSREITCLETLMLPRLTSTAWKASACLTWLQPTVLSSANKQTGNEMKTLPWSSRHRLIPQRHFIHLAWEKDELHFPKTGSKSSKAERLLNPMAWQSWLLVRLARSVPCKNKQKVPCERKTVDFSHYYFYRCEEAQRKLIFDDEFCHALSDHLTLHLGDPSYISMSGGLKRPHQNPGTGMDRVQEPLVLPQQDQPPQQQGPPYELVSSPLVTENSVAPQETFSSAKPSLSLW